MTSDQTSSDLRELLLRLDSNQQPFGQQPPYDGVRPQSDYQGKHRSVGDQSRPEPTGFNCGKTAADLGPYAGFDTDARRYNALGWPAFVGAFLSLAIVAAVVLGVVGVLS